MKKALIIIFLFIATFNVNAHQSSTSFISIEESEKNLRGIWKVAFESIQENTELDINNDNKVQWYEVRENKNKLAALLKSHLKFTVNSDCYPEFAENNILSMENIMQAHYLVLEFNTTCKLRDIRQIQYNYYMDIDNNHKGILAISQENKEPVIHVFSSEIRDIEIQQESVNTFFGLVNEGVWHILIGFDHIIFVLTLIIGVMFTKKKNINTRKNTIEIIKVVTAFTLAHSITLALAAFDVISIPVSVVESAIALTLIIAAIYNLKYLMHERVRCFMSWSVWKMAFVFGLIHGFGFANVLSELTLSSVNMAKTLLAFNLGVELGQIMIVLVSVLVFSLICRTKSIKNNNIEYIAPVSSVFVIFLGTVWVVERSFDLSVF